MRKKRKHKTTTDKTDECKTAKRRYRATSSRQKTATKRWKTTTNDRHKKCKKTTRKHKTTKDSKQPQKRWKPAANRPHRRTTSETKQNRYRDTEKKSLKDLKQTERDAQRPQRRKMWIRIIINKDAQQQKGHKKPSKTTTQAERPRRETKRLETATKKEEKQPRRDAKWSQKGTNRPQRCMKRQQRTSTTTTKRHKNNYKTTHMHTVHRHAKKTDAPNDTTANRLHTDSKQWRGEIRESEQPQGHTHKTTKRLQTNCKTKQTQNLKRVKKMNTNRRGNIWFVSPEVLALMSEGFNVSAGPSSARQHTN